GGEERLTGHDVDVEAGLLVVPVLVGERALGAVGLRHAVLLGREAGECVGAVAVISHLRSSLREYWSGDGWLWRPGSAAYGRAIVAADVTAGMVRSPSEHRGDRFERGRGRS